MRFADIRPDDLAAAAAYYKAGRTDGTWTHDKSEALLRTVNDPRSLLAEMANIDHELASTGPEGNRRACIAISEAVRNAREQVDALRARLDDDQADIDERVGTVAQLLQRADQLIVDIEGQLSATSGNDGPLGGAEQGSDPANPDAVEVARRAIAARASGRTDQPE